MNRDQLRARYTSALNRHWRACMDHSGPTPALLDELAGIAEEHALGAVVREQVSTSYAVPQELREAWDEIKDAPTGTGGGGGGHDAPPLVVTPNATESRTVGARTPRTRARTRGGPK